MTPTNGRPVAVRRRKRALTKTNDGGRGRAARQDGRLDPSERARTSRTDGAAAEPAGPPRPPAIYLAAARELTAAARLSFCFFFVLFLTNLFVSAESAGSAPSGGVLKQTCPLTRLPSSTSPPEENEKNAVKLKEDEALTTISEA